MFDVPDQASVRHEWDVDIPVEDFAWQVGLIVGPSGSGKTTIGRRLFPDALFHSGYEWPQTGAVVDGFPARLDGREVAQALSSVGFSSPPHWLKRYAHLSNGQKFRCELARLMLEDAELVLFDEFTSVVDRDAARVSSAAVARALRRRGRPRLPGVVGPLPRQVQFPVDQRPAAPRRLTEKDPDLAILDPADCAAVLPGDPSRLGPLLQEPGLVHDQHAVRVAEVFGQLPAVLALGVAE
jgi:hypothetical protein